MKALEKAKQVERQTEGFWEWLFGGRGGGGSQG
jgi:hypothetical protein